MRHLTRVPLFGENGYPARHAKAGASLFRMDSGLKRHKYEAVIFDLDGTLINSLSVWHDVDITFLGRRGLAVPPTLQKDLGGLSMYEIGEYFQTKFGLSDTVEEMMAEWNELAYEDYRYRFGLKEGAEDFLHFLKKEGFSTGLATSNSRELVEASFEKNRLYDVIDVIVSSNEVPHGKPEPDIYLACAERLSAIPERCLVFEDHPDGILAARRAGMTVWAVADDYTSDAEEEKRRAAAGFITDFTEFDRSLLFE